jgi:hypothetical protein
MIAEPIYLLDFRNGRVREIDPAGDERAAERPEDAPEPREGAVTFAALGSPIDRED